MRNFMQIVENSEVDRLTELAKRHDDVESFLNATDGMDVLYRGHGDEEVSNDSFMTDYIGHARGYGGGHVDAFAVDLYNDVYRFRDDQFDQMRFALRRLDDDEFAQHYAQVLPERMAGFLQDWLPIARQVIEEDEPFEDTIATDPQKNDAMVPLMQAWGATKGKNIICFMGGDYGDYGGQMEFVVHDVSKLVNLRKLYAQVHQQITESYLESGRAPLYHWTNPESARYILEKGKITASLFGVGQVCVTRDKNFHFNKNCVRLEIDADAVRHNLKVTPFDYTSMKHSWSVGTERREEKEERIHGDVSIRAIKGITVFDNGFIFKNDYWTKQTNTLIANAKAAGIPLAIEASPHKIEESVEGDWFDKGTPVKIDDWEAVHFLEDDEFYLDWRLCLVPAGAVQPNLLDPEESNSRIADIRQWAGEDLFERLKEEPPVMLLSTMKLLDGNHRAHVAQEAGLEFIPMLVGK